MPLQRLKTNFRNELAVVEPSAVALGLGGTGDPPASARARRVASDKDSRLTRQRQVAAGNSQVGRSTRTNSSPPSARYDFVRLILIRKFIFENHSN